VKIYGSVVQEVKDEMKRQGREDEFIGSRVSCYSRSVCHLPSADHRFLPKIIYTTIKVITPEELNWFTEDCLALKKEFPDLIAGSYHTDTD